MRESNITKQNDVKSSPAPEIDSYAVKPEISNGDEMCKKCNLCSKLYLNISDYLKYRHESNKKYERYDINRRV